MGLFDTKQSQNKVQGQKSKKIGLNELNEDVLLNVAGGQTYHNDVDKLANEKYIKELTKKPL